MEPARRMVTFLFTDVEGSTRRWAADPELMAKELALHDELLGRVVDEHGGLVFNRTGDGVCAAFPSPGDAVRAAVAAQAQLALPVRMGVHTGEAEQRDGDWFGAELTVVARIMDAGHGGQLLCSAATAALLPPEFERRSLGEYRLKGLDRQQTIFQIGSGRFPPLRAGASMVELPERRTSLLGRAELLSRIDAALDEHRLVTLVGPGGVGKTSVAIEAARRRTGLVEQVVFADLATVADGDGVVAAVARALGVAVPRLDAIELALGAADTLIVVDNCEHVIDAAAEVIEQLLRRRARVLATSREHLELDGEVVVPVAPLTDDAVAVALFLERAADAGAPPAPQEAGQVAELCRRLDGLPLAIELAASRLAVLSVGQLLDHLGERLELLAAGRRRGRDRHRTLRDTISWSCDLLDAGEQDLYRRLSVFVDWFGLDDAVAVAGPLRPIDVLDGLGSLASKSLLVVVGDGGSARYRFLECIRDHAWEQLVVDNRDDELMALLADHVAAKLAELGRRVWDGPDDDPFGQMVGMIPLQQHALEWALSNAQVERAKALLLPFATAIPSGHPGGVAGASRLADLTESMDGRDPELLAMALLEKMYSGDFTSYRSTIHEIILVADLTSASQPLITVLMLLTGMAGDAALQHQVLEAAPAFDGPFGSYLEAGGAFAEPSEGQLAQVIALIDEMPTAAGRSHLCSSAAFIAQALERPELAAELSDRVVAEIPEPNSALVAAWSQKASFHLGRGELVEAIDCAHRVEQSARRMGERSALIPVIVVHALVLWKLGRVEDCARVRGAAPRRWALFFLRERDEMDAWLAQQLTSEELAALAAKGRAMPLDDVLAVAPSALRAAALA